MINKITHIGYTFYINFIDKEMECLHEDNQYKAHKYQIKKAYLKEVLSRFPEKLKQEGLSILNEYEFPYPSLM